MLVAPPLPDPSAHTSGEESNSGKSDDDLCEECKGTYQEVDNDMKECWMGCDRCTTVEPLKEDPPRKGHCIKYLSTKDKNKSPNLSLPINIMQLEPLRRGQPL